MRAVLSARIVRARLADGLNQQRAVNHAEKEASC